MFIMGPSAESARPTCASRGVDDGEFDLLVVGAQVDEQAENFVHHGSSAGVRAVDFVDDQDGHQAVLEGLLHDEPGLGHRSFGRVHDQQRPVHHVQDALDFSREVHVAGRVHDVDGAVPELDRGVFGENGDTAPIYSCY